MYSQEEMLTLLANALELFCIGCGCCCFFGVPKYFRQKRFYTRLVFALLWLTLGLAIPGFINWFTPSTRPSQPFEC